MDDPVNAYSSIKVIWTSSHKLIPFPFPPFKYITLFLSAMAIFVNSTNKYKRGEDCQYELMFNQSVPSCPPLQAS